MEPRKVLESVRFFSEALTPPELSALRDAARVGAFPRGTVILRQGELGASLWVIADGKVSVGVHSREGEKRVATLSAGDIVGEMSLFTGARRSATVTALRQVTAVEVSKDALKSVVTDAAMLVRRFAGLIEQRHAELDNLHAAGERWYSAGISPGEIVARMTAFYTG